jgi:transcription elongation factor GreA
MRSDAMATHATNGQSAGRSAQKERFPLTPEGYAALKKELEFLITVQRPQVADFIHEAKEAGDISESSAYEEAKNRQAMLEGRIKQLQYTLDNSYLMQSPTNKRAIGLGSVVDVETDRGTRTLKLVSTVEADARTTPQKVSDQSPVGRALMGKAEGDHVEVTTPGGSVTYTVRSIRWEG